MSCGEAITKVMVSTFAEQQRLLAQAYDQDWPSPEEIIQRMVEDLLTQCTGDYEAAHDAIEDYSDDENTWRRPRCLMVSPLMTWCGDKSEAHEAIERHRQMAFPWWPA